MKVVPQQKIQNAFQTNAAKKTSSPFVDVSTEAGEPINFAELLSGEVNLNQTEDVAPTVSEELINNNLNQELVTKNELPVKKELLKYELPNNEIKTRSLNDILKEAKDSVEHSYIKAKNNAAELERLFVKQPQAIAQDHNVVALNTESAQPVQKFDIESLLQNKTTEKETFYKNSQPLEYRSMFNAAKIKETRDSSPTETSALELNDTVHAQVDAQNLLSNLSANKTATSSPAPSQLLKSYQEFNERPMLELRTEKEEVTQPIVHKPVNAEMMDSSFSFAPAVTELKHEGHVVTTPVKVLDLSGMNVSNTDEAINRISDYIQQNHMAARPTIELKFNHQDLGNVGIHVERNDNNTLNISIQTTTNEGRSFFAQNQQELFSTLNSNGLKVADIKLESHSSFSKHSEDGSTSEHGKQSFSQQFSSQDGQRKHESQRRQELWASYKRQQEVA